MALHDLLIVGSGPSGTAAALQAAGKARVLLLDAGLEPGPLPGTGGEDFASVRGDADLAFRLLLGERFEALANLSAAQPLSLKLKQPGLRFIIERAQELSPVSTENFAGLISLARGGLANGWGAGVYRFTQADLAGFPFGAQDLAPFYDALSAEIGIAGSEDDLTPWFGADPALLPPLPCTALAEQLLERYAARRAQLNHAGLYLGRTRLAVLTRAQHGRPAYRHRQMEFFRARDPAVYTPAYTLERLIQEGAVDYRPGWLVRRFRETEEGVCVEAERLDGGGSQTFHAHRLLLAAGGLNSSRIVLASAGDTHSRLPILDNPLSAFPLLRVGRLGLPRDPLDTAFGQLNLVFQEGEAPPLQGTIYGINGALRADSLLDLPLPLRSAAALLRAAVSAALVVLTFHPGRPRPGNYLRLLDNGALDVHYAPDEDIGPAEARLIRLFGKLGYRGHPALVKRTPMGSSLHYAGILPLRHEPGRYECHPDGRLYGTRHVHLIDGACLPALPAKNLTLTLMANAMRIVAGLEGAP